MIKYLNNYKRKNKSRKESEIVYKEEVYKERTRSRKDVC